MAGLVYWVAGTCQSKRIRTARVAPYNCRVHPRPVAGPCAFTEQYGDEEDVVDVSS